MQRILILLRTGENGAASAAAQKDRNTLTVLCVDFPEYDWTRSIIDAANSRQPASASQDKNAKKIVVQLLNTAGADMHSYQPTIADMVKIANCDLLIYNGGASQFWVEDALKAYPNPDRQVLSLMRLFESEPDRFPTYVQDEDEHEHEHHHHDGEECSCGHHHHHHHGHDADEVFSNFGVETAKKFTREELENALSRLSSEEYGTVLRAKGIVAGADGTWFHFDFVPEEFEVRTGSADVTGRMCVIGAKLAEDKIKALFGV